VTRSYRNAAIATTKLLHFFAFAFRIFEVRYRCAPAAVSFYLKSLTSFKMSVAELVVELPQFSCIFLLLPLEFLK